MGSIKVEGVTHWSIPVNNLEESEAFYGDVLGLTPVGRLGTARMSCFTAGGHHILLCERAATIDHTFVEDPKVHHSFTVSPETLVQACKIFAERKIPIDRLYYRAKGFFTGRELYFFDPSGNRLELPWLSSGVVQMAEPLGLRVPANQFVVAALKHYIDGRPADARPAPKA